MFPLNTAILCGELSYPKEFQRMEKETKLVTSQELPVYMSRSLCHLRCRKASWWWFLPKIPHQYHWNMIRIHLPVYFMTWSEQAEAPVAWVFLVWSMPVTQWQESCRILCVWGVTLPKLVENSGVWPNDLCLRYSLTNRGMPQFLAWIMKMRKDSSNTMVPTSRFVSNKKPNM